MDQNKQNYVQLENETNQQGNIQRDMESSIYEDKLSSIDINYEKQQEEYIQQQRQEILENYRQKPLVKYMFIFGCMGITFLFYNNNFQGLLQEYIKEGTGISDTQFQLFQTLSGGPTVPLILFGGVISDIIGISVGITIYSTISVIGMIVVTIGGYQVSFTWLLVGRIIYNIGMQMTAAATGSLMAKWFKGQELTKFSSLQQGSLKLGLVTSSLIYPRLYPIFDNIGFPILMGTIVAFLSYIIGLGAPIQDILADKKAKKIKSQIEQPKKKMNFQDFKKFDLYFWIIILSFLINSAINYTFLTNIYAILNPKFKISQTNAGDLLSIANIVGLFSPLGGILMKKYNKFYEVLILACIFSVIQYLFFIFVPECSESCFPLLIFPIILFGLYIAMFAIVTVPAIAQSCPPQLVGTAFGLAFSLKNGAEALIPIISVGPLLDNYDTVYTMIFFLILSLITLGISFILYIMQNKINKKKQQQQQQLLQQQNQEEKLYE